LSRNLLGFRGQRIHVITHLGKITIKTKQPLELGMADEPLTETALLNRGCTAERVVGAASGIPRKDSCPPQPQKKKKKELEPKPTELLMRKV
jgi:hypothetical protein